LPAVVRSPIVKMVCVHWMLACAQYQVNFKGVASCSQLSYCQNVICSLTDDLCTCQVNFRGRSPAVVRSPIVKMVCVHWMMACVQYQVNFRGGVASCCQVSCCQDVICSLTDGLRTVSRELQGGLPAVVSSPIVKMVCIHWLMACVQCQVNFRGVASCCQVSYCQDVICSLIDDLCTVSGGFQGGVASCCQLSYCQNVICSLTDDLCTCQVNFRGRLPAVVRSPIVKMVCVHWMMACVQYQVTFRGLPAVVRSPIVKVLFVHWLMTCVHCQVNFRGGCQLWSGLLLWRWCVFIEWWLVYSIRW